MISREPCPAMRACCHSEMVAPTAIAAIMMRAFSCPCRCKKILHFDPDTGLLTAESGMLLSEIIAHVASHGYFLPVTPGTQFVTLGGAIANDVHGKTITGRVLSGVMLKAGTASLGRRLLQMFRYGAH